MLDHFRAKGERKSDWTATWRKWLRNSRKFTANGHAKDVKAPRMTPTQEWTNKVEREAAEELAQLRKGKAS